MPHAALKENFIKGAVRLSSLDFVKASSYSLKLDYGRSVVNIAAFAFMAMLANVSINHLVLWIIAAIQVFIAAIVMGIVFILIEDSPYFMY